MKIIDKKTILFTIEIKNRELSSKCLLALECAKRGMRTYIGTFEAIENLRYKISSSIFFHKSTTFRNVPNHKKYYGATTVFLDEEAGFAIPRPKIEAYCKIRYKTVNPEHYRHIFVIGNKYYKYINSMNNCHGVNVHACGWPRIDLWRESFNSVYLDKAEEIKREYGKFYLFISSFGATSAKGFNERDSFLKDKNYSAVIDINDERRRAFFEHVELIKRISEHLKSDEIVIIRPHASEKIKAWAKIFKQYGNVKVIHEGDVTPWLLASNALINYNSTVGVQAALNGIPSIIYNAPLTNHVTDTPVFDISEHAKTVEEVLDFFERNKNIDPNIIKEKVFELIRDDVSSLEGETASSKIAAILSAIEVEKVPPILITKNERIRHLIYYYKGFTKFLLNRSNLFKKASEIKQQTYEKVPGGITKTEISSMLNKLAPIVGVYQSDIICEQVSKNLVTIELKSL